MCMLNSLTAVLCPYELGKFISSRRLTSKGTLPLKDRVVVFSGPLLCMAYGSSPPVPLFQHGEFFVLPVIQLID